MENQLSIERFLRCFDEYFYSSPQRSPRPSYFLRITIARTILRFAVFVSRTADRAIRQRATEGTRGKKSGALRRLTPALLCKPYYFARPPRFVGNCSRGCEEKCGTRPRKSTRRGVSRCTPGFGCLEHNDGTAIAGLATNGSANVLITIINGR